MSRLTLDKWAMSLALITSRRSTCLRRAVGCVLLNNHHHIIATGYNGVASGMPHCNHRDIDGRYPFACTGARAQSGQNLDLCEAIHAEQNALLQCHNMHTIKTIYVTASPCVTCTKLLLNTSCTEIVYIDEYPHEKAKALWHRAGRIWRQMDLCKI